MLTEGSCHLKGSQKYSEIVKFAHHYISIILIRNGIVVLNDR